MSLTTYFVSRVLKKPNVVLFYIPPMSKVVIFIRTGCVKEWALWTSHNSCEVPLVIRSTPAHPMLF